MARRLCTAFLAWHASAWHLADCRWGERAALLALIPARINAVQVPAGGLGHVRLLEEALACALAPHALVDCVLNILGFTADGNRLTTGLASAALTVLAFLACTMVLDGCRQGVCLFLPQSPPPPSSRHTSVYSDRNASAGHQPSAVSVAVQSPAVGVAGLLHAWRIWSDVNNNGLGQHTLRLLWGTARVIVTPGLGILLLNVLLNGLGILLLYVLLFCGGVSSYCLSRYREKDAQRHIVFLGYKVSRS